MAYFTIKTRDHGDLEFVTPGSDPDGSYVYLDGARRQQICEGGGFTGHTLTATDEELPSVARRWWKQRLRHLNSEPA